MNENLELPELITPKEVREYLKCSNENVYTLLKQKDFPCFKIGRSYRIRKKDFIEWVNNQKLELRYFK